MRKVNKIQKLLALKTGNQKNKINKPETWFFENIIKIG